MNIKVKQRDITDCGAACLASVATYYRLQLPVARIRQIAGTDLRGTNVLGMVRAAEKLGFSAKGVKGTKESLKKIPLPSIAHIVVDKKLNHYVVICKVKNNQIKYMDPADGQIHTITVDAFCEMWTNILVLLIPGDGFQRGNQKISNLKRFFFLISPHKSTVIQCLIGAIIYTILGLATSVYIQKITDEILPSGNKNLLNLLSIGMLFILFMQIFIGVFQSIFMLKTGQQIDTRLILGYYKHLLHLPQQFFDTMRVGEIISRINDAVKIRVFINDVSVSLIVNVFIVFFSFAMMFFYSIKLALIMLIVIPLFAALYILTNNLNKKQERKLMEHAAELESQLVESLNSVRTIKQFGIEDFSNVKTENKFVSFMHTVFRSATNSLFTGTTSGFINRFITIVLLWVGSYYVIGKEITPGELLSFYSIIGYFTGPIASLIGANNSIQNAIIASDRLFEIMDLEREAEINKIELKKNNLGDIQFEHISFAYGTRKEVFTDFSLTIPLGELTAVIGESGSGKTTLASLLQKLYPLKSGRILINGQDINFFTSESLRKIITTVPQQLNLFAGDIIENIALGDFEPNTEKIISIIKELGLLPFVEKLPNGLNTYIGENGTTLSGGEKQRVAIARALYRNSEIIILDEATSSLDSESEQFVQQAVRQLKRQGKTIIIIAHRLSTVVNADNIVVLENGKVIEQGMHDELYAAKGRYFQMWEKQLPVFI